ncbi:MAG: LptF/LptG family permease, partial [Elusimicrobia bacterium]|nr:LptF/LptG family permease [Elusimicrobiota bacterium]
FNAAILIGADPWWLLYSMAQLLPMIMALSLPMAFALAALLALASMSEQGEILALRAAGFSFKQVIWPLGLCAVILSGTLFWINNWESPKRFKTFQQSKYALTEKLSKIRIEPKTFVNVGEWRIYAGWADNSTGELKSAHVFRSPKAGTWSMRISAPRGKYFVSAQKGFGLELLDGEFQRIDSAEPSRVVMAKFSKYNVFIPFSSEGKKREISLAEMSTAEIFKAIKAKTLPAQRETEFKVEAMTRFVMALSPIIFFWISCPLALGMAKKSRAWGLVWSIVILFSFYGAMAIGIGLGRKFHYLAWCAPWLPIMLGFSAGTYLWKKRTE